MSSPHYKPRPELKASLITEEQDKRVIKPAALDIIWGGDSRYWKIPDTADPKSCKDPINLLQVSWLEVTGSLDLASLESGKEYKVTFMLELKSDAFGWNDSPVYLMAKPGKSGPYCWKKSDLSKLKTGVKTAVPDQPLCFKVSQDTQDKLQFGMYEIWKGRWKGGLIIHEVIIEPLT